MSHRFPPAGELFLLGKIVRSHGTDGRMRLMLPDRLVSYIRKDIFLFINHDGSRVPYRITGVEEGPHLVVTMEGIHSKEQSDALAGKEIWIPVNHVKARDLAVHESLPSQWQGYTLQDTLTGLSFHIVRTEEYPQQLMAVVEHEGRELLIPLHDRLITGIDHEEKVIVMEVPEGLLGL